MPRPFKYELTFRIHADTTAALVKIGALRTAMRDMLGPQAARGRVQAHGQVTAAQEKETKATKDGTTATTDKAKANQTLYTGMLKLVRVIGAAYLAWFALKTAITAVINFYRQLWGVIQRGIGILAALGREVVTNTAEFETLRIRMEAVSKTAEHGQRAFEKLMKWVVGMPFTLREAADAYVYLEATGVAALMGFSRSMNVAATMAKTMDRSIKDAALAIAKLYAGNMQRLTRGFAIAGERLLPYGAVEGQSAGTLEHKAPGAARANVEALYRFVEDRWGTLLQRMRNTWRQLVNDMTDIWEQITEAIGRAGALGALKDMLAYIRTLYEFLRDQGAISAWAKAISDAWTPVLESVGPWLENLPSIMQTIVGWIVTLGEKTDAWLTSMGGVEGIWQKILSGLKEYGPDILNVLRTYAWIMTQLGQALTSLAGVPLSMAAGWYAITGQGEKLGQVSGMVKSGGAAFKAQGKLRESMMEMFDNAIELIDGLEVGGGAIPGQPGHTRGAGATSGGGGEARQGMRDLALAVESGAESGVEKGLEKVFGKNFMGRAGGQYNPYAALYLALTGQGQRKQAPVRPGTVAGTTFAPGDEGYQAMLESIGFKVGRPGVYDPRTSLADAASGLFGAMSISKGGYGPFDPRRGGPRPQSEWDIAKRAFAPGGALLRDFGLGLGMVRRVDRAQFGGIEVHNYLGGKELKRLTSEVQVNEQRGNVSLPAHAMAP